MASGDQAVQLDRARFERRLKTIAAAWSWPLDAVVLIEGKPSEDAQQYKTEAMHHWLMGIEFPDTVVVLLKTGRVLFMGSSSKLKYLRQIDGPEVVYLERPSQAAVDPAQLAEIVKAIQGDKQEAVCGMLQKEKHIGPFAADFINELSKSQGLKLVECKEEISSLLAPKDVEEIDCTKRSANVAQLMLEEILKDKLEKAIDGDRTVANSALCDEVEAELENKELLQQWKNKHGIDADSMDLVYVSLQSGGAYDLKPAVEPTQDNVPMQGTYLMSIGMKYTEYSACIARTLLVDPTPIQKSAYILALAVQQQIVDQLKPGARFADIYTAALNLVVTKKPELRAQFVKSCGFVMGLEFKDPQQVISDRSDKQVRAGTAFCVSVGFCETGAKPWAVWLADTVTVGADKSEVQTSKSPKDTESVMYELDGGDPPPPDPAPKAPVQAPSIESAVRAAPAPARAAASAPKAATARAPKQEPARSTRGKPQVEQSRRTSRTASERKPATPELAGRNIMESRTRTRNAQTIQDMSEAVQMEDKQREFREKKFEELQERFSGSTARVEVASKGSRLHDLQAYKSPDDLPGSARANRVEIDPNSDALLVPISGSIVPFHVATIKNMARQTIETYEYLRVNFFVPGQGKSIEDYPIVNGNRVYVKELSFRSESKDNFDTVARNFKDAQKRLKQRELEAETKAQHPSTASSEILQPMRSGFPNIRDVNMRPALGGRGGRTLGTLEAHQNGFRFSIRQGLEKIDILYSQVAHAIFEPCETGSLIVLIHLNLKEPLIVKSKRMYDIQFFTEVAAQTEDLSMKKSNNAYDPDEILEEQREREMKERLNRIFQDFSKKVEAIDTCRLQFDIPFKEFAFYGVPGSCRGVVNLCPCSRALVALQEWPPFSLSLDQVDIVVFERVSNSLREFDMVFVKKDYDQPPVRITTIVQAHMDKIKRWLMELGTVWYSCSMNMQWPIVMKEVNKDLKAFAANGGWEPWFPSMDNADSEESGEEQGSDFEAGSEEDDDDDDGEDAGAADSGDSDFSNEPEDSSDAPDEQEEDGMDWDELEEKAERDDRKRDSDKSRQPQPAAKKRRR